MKFDIKNIIIILLILGIIGLGIYLTIKLVNNKKKAAVASPVSAGSGSIDVNALLASLTAGIKK